MTGEISIVIPSFNHGQFLQEAATSIRAVRGNLVREVIVVDDGSTHPGTLRVLEELEADGCIVIRQGNSGVGAARNAGIRKATGEFILPLDDDNRLRQTYLVEGLAMLKADPRAGIVYGDAEYFGDRSGRWTTPEFDLAELIRGNFIDACALYRKRVWEDVGGYDEKMPHMGWEDWDFWLRAAIKGWEFAHLPQVAFDYRVRAGSMLSEVNRHNEIMDEYLFSKRELAAFGKLRPALRRLANIEKSFEYRLGNRLFAPIRRVQKAIR